jgi:hypothetical protein
MRASSLHHIALHHKTLRHTTRLGIGETNNNANPYITLHHNTLHSIARQFWAQPYRAITAEQDRTQQGCKYISTIAQDYIALHYTTRHGIAMRCIATHSNTLRTNSINNDSSLHYSTLQYNTMRLIAEQSSTMTFPRSAVLSWQVQLLMAHQAYCT